MSEKLGSLKWWLMLPAFLVFAFYFPRYLIQTLGADNPWTSYLYLYGFGFFYTGSGVLLILKTGACNLSRPLHRKWFALIVGGFFYFAIAHALWIYLAISIPYKGAL
ncbi:MAG: hypothetical protein KDD33_01980 [Bdellovibrionales bacterium]|nr:hypothetical protein [Bdellovibrionales bacterium]